MPLHIYTKKKRLRILAKSICPPAAPSGLQATVASATEIDLAWTNNASNQTGFQVQRSPDNTTWTNLSTVGPTTLAYNDTGLTAGTLYYYRVAAYNSAGNSAWSNVASAITLGQAFYIAPNAGSGAGTLANPYGLADLQVYNSAGADSYYGPGPAITNLQPGQTLYFRGGSYPIQGVAWNGGFNNQGQKFALGPTTSGTSIQPITIRNYPGEAVTITQTSPTQQPTFGNLQSYVRYLGLTINASTGDTTGYQTLPIFNFSDGSHNEVGYCKLVGRTWYSDDGDNYEAIELGADSGLPFSCEHNWIHYNEISGYQCQSHTHNSCGIKVYSAGPHVIEDNYIHDCTTGIYEKQGGMPSQPAGYQDFTYRRNYIINNYGFPILGPGQGGTVQQATLHIYDNVFDDSLNMQDQQTGTQIYNNLFLNATQEAGNDYSKPTWLFIVDFADPTNIYNRATYLTQIWNNVVFPASSPFIPLQQIAVDFTPLTSSTTPLSYMDYNVYTATINYYYFNDPYTTQFTQAQFQAAAAGEGLTQGGEQYSQTVAGPLSIYADQTSYQLLPQWQTAGRYGDAVGPRVAIGGPGGIMDTTRYGPSAIGSYT
jgi:hypothetical protein